MPPDEVDLSDGSVDGGAARLAELQARLDDVSQQLLVSRDATLGAEAELSVALARIAELEQRLHVSTIEVDELQEKVLLLTTAREATPQHPNPVARRLSPLLARAARATQ